MLYSLRIARFFVFIFIAFFVSSCQKGQEYSFERDGARYRHNRQAILERPQGDINEGESSQPYAPDENKTWKVVALLPLTGKNAVFGRQAMDALTLALFDSQINNVKLIPLDVGDTPEMAINAAKIATSIVPDIAIGPIFSDTAKIIAPMLNKSNIEMIILSNDISLAKHGGHVFGIIPENMTLSTLEFAKVLGRQNLGCILPSTARGSAISQKLNAITTALEMRLLFTEHYSEHTDYDQLGGRIYRQKKQTYYRDKEGKTFKINIKDRNKEQLNGIEDSIGVSKVTEVLDAIYIDGKGAALYKVLGTLRKHHILDKDITIMINEAKDYKELIDNPYASGVIFAGTNDVGAQQFEQHFSSIYQYQPIKIASLAYDAMTTTMYLIKHNLRKDIMYRETGFTGLFGDFRFTPDKVVQRRFSIYRIQPHGIELVEKMNAFL